MGRWWTGYTSRAGERACIVHSHEALWRLASPCGRQSSRGYALFEAKIPSEKMRLITAYGVRNVKLMVPQREVAVAPFHMRAGALEHLRERGGLRLELVVRHRAYLPSRSTRHKQRRAQALGQRTQRLACCHRPSRSHT